MQRALKEEKKNTIKEKNKENSQSENSKTLKNLRKEGRDNIADWIQSYEEDWIHCGMCK